MSCFKFQKLMKQMSSRYSSVSLYYNVINREPEAKALSEVQG